MSRHQPEHGADSAEAFDDRGDADFVCEGPCGRTIYSGLLTQVDGKMLCRACSEQVAA